MDHINVKIYSLAQGVTHRMMKAPNALVLIYFLIVCLIIYHKFFFCKWAIEVKGFFSYKLVIEMEMEFIDY